MCLVCSFPALSMVTALRNQFLLFRLARNNASSVVTFSINHLKTSSYTGRLGVIILQPSSTIFQGIFLTPPATHALSMIPYIRISAAKEDY
ncbi:hypothetical protein F5Y17DRAFT_360737 [Xylariaceae sp. FL0594]|nr:hypothetical protein F5Y17DRAFT_360737 [Xylariaceae sp. FL0594]